MTTSILLAGVGGQGVVVAGDVLAKALLYSGFDVKKSEIHGMAQRGGSVFSHVRFGEKVYSPVIPTGSADFIVSFENMEFLRYLEYTNNKTVLILNTARILPPSVNMGEEKYPEEAVEEYKGYFASFEELNADSVAESLGSRKAAGTVLLSVLSKYLPVKQEAWEAAIRSAFSEKIAELNLKCLKSMGKYYEDNQSL
ncbi:MAG: indolepyruvate oxidoreductase subunit beta [Deferribacteraceae bacterium]|jgi:indolepyruvate ferredoxin oxidoreductase beta subunit|nr:indolepyruvate oxidoreductase subunit beta [Deferribacteraceae bacterium]